MAGELPFIAFNFSVELQVANAGTLGLANPLCSAEFAECDGLEMTMEPKTVPCRSTNSRHCRGPFQRLRSRRIGRTFSRGTVSTRVKMSEASSASLHTMLSEQLPTSTVVTPWRTDSERLGATISSAS